MGTIPSAPGTNISLGPSLAPTSRSISSAFGDSAPHALSEFYRLGPLVPNNPANAGIPTSGTISLSQFNGATSTPATQVLQYQISAQTTNLDLYTHATSTAPAPTRWTPGAPAQITFTIDGPAPAGVLISSPSTSVAAVQVPSQFPTPLVSLTLVNNGNITGKGGNGGAGGAGGNPTGAQPGQPGQSGGTAIQTQRPITITNNGTIRSGNGGGGGGGGKNFEDVQVGTPQGGTEPSPSPGGGGGGGGGGVGYQMGSGAAGGPHPIYPGSSGQNATPQPGYGGTRGLGGAGGRPVAGSGGNGGVWPTAAQAGGNGSTSGGAAGAQGYYISGDPFVTWPVTGTRQGQAI